MTSLSYLYHILLLHHERIHFHQEIQRVLQVKKNVSPQKIWKPLIAGDHRQNFDSMTCFFSIGYLDADISLRFHELREANPTLAQNRAMNKFWYFGFGVHNFLSNETHVSSLLILEVDGQLIPIPEEVSTIQVFNIHSSGDGVDFFGIAQDSTRDDLLQKYQNPSMSDGLVEVVGTEGVFHLLTTKAQIQHSRRLAQGKTVCIKYLEKIPIPVQLDGEPWAQEGPCEITISHRDRFDVVLGTGSCRAL